MARMAATPAIAYGCDIVGMSDTHLQAARVAVAASAAPSSGGKSPDMILFALDVAGGSLDPIFSATVLLIKHWALAWWDGWAARRDLADAMLWAIAKLRHAQGSVWHYVSGPTTALVASLWRIGWSIIDAQSFVSDDGSVLNCLTDSPAAIALEANRSVHRWQLARVVKLNPLILPPRPSSGSSSSLDAGSHALVPARHEPPLVVRVADLTARLPPSVVGVTRPLARLLHGRNVGVKTQPLWEKKHRPYLLSTMVGGQWTQTRVAQVQGPDTSRLCQLCHTADGTLDHRRMCPATMPCGGWPKPSAAVDSFITQLDPARRRFLSTRGILLIDIPIPPPSRDGWIRWLKPLPNMDLTGATWYIDGSAIDGPARLTARLGFAVVVVSKEGDLMAFAQGVPPGWVRDSAGAEMWALFVVLSCNPGLPRTVTDCLGLLDMMARGVEEATRACRPMARLWAMIFRCTGTVVPTFGPEDDFIWMPSHCTAATALFTLKSNSCPVSPVEWRANRLADGLAKHAATKGNMSANLLDNLHRANACVECAAAMVGTTSWHANNAHRTTWSSTGEALTLKCRDSALPPAHKIGNLTGLNRRNSAKPDDEPHKQLAKRTAPTETTPRPRDLANLGAKAAATQKEAEKEARSFNTWLRDLDHKALQPQAATKTAAQRLEELRERVRAKSAARRSEEN